jgi:hypothetical protein
MHNRQDSFLNSPSGRTRGGPDWKNYAASLKCHDSLPFLWPAGHPITFGRHSKESAKNCWNRNHQLNLPYWTGLDAYYW